MIAKLTNNNQKPLYSLWYLNPTQCFPILQTIVYSPVCFQVCLQQVVTLNVPPNPYHGEPTPTDGLGL